MGLLIIPEGVLAGVPGATATQGWLPDVMLPDAAFVVLPAAMLAPGLLVEAVRLGAAAVVMRGGCSCEELEVLPAGSGCSLVAADDCCLSFLPPSRW